MDPNNMDMMSYLKIKKLVEEEEEEEEEEDESAEEDEADDADDDDDDAERERSVKLDSQLKQQQQKKKRLSSTGEGGSRISASCLVESCHTDLTGCKKYYQRHRVCEVHAKAPAVSVDGIRQRFCQQCSRFHETTEFDQTKRSCRRRLAGHNERRRKSSLESQKNGTLPRHLNAIQTEVEPRGHKDFEILYKSL